MSRDFERGDSDYLVNSSTVLIPTIPYTVAAWCKIEAIGADEHMVLSIYRDGNNFASCRIDDTGGTLSPQFVYREGGTTNFAETTNTMTVGTWHHATFVNTGTAGVDQECIVYLDGGDKTSGGTAALDDLTSITGGTAIGRYNSASPTDYFDGKMAHLAVWDKALSDAEVTSLQTDTPDNVAAANLQYYWAFTTSSLTDSEASLVLTNNGTTYDAADDPSLGGGAGSALSLINAYYG